MPSNIDTSPPWQALSSHDCLQQLNSSPQGLSQSTAEQRLAQVGANALPPLGRRGPVQRLLAQFHNVLLYVMLGAAGIAALLQHWVDAGVIFAAVLINAVIGFIQEGRAESALASIRQLLSTHARVVRDGRIWERDAQELVPGDIVLLEAGDKVPADLRLLQLHNLHIEEATLTGESVAVSKQLQPVAIEASLGDRTNMAYSGTLVVRGQARGLVVATGPRTELGQINHLLTRVDVLTTPLLRQIDRFGRWLALVILGLVGLTFLLGTLWVGLQPGEMFMMSIALTAAAIPEGLPAIMTVMLALGVQRMAHHQAIIRRLPAVETLGSVTVICSDKTGTLTRNEMTVQQICCDHHHYTVTGAGYQPTGEIYQGKQVIQPQQVPALAALLRTGILCNDAQLQAVEDSWQITGDPTEGALLVLGAKGGQAVQPSEWQRLDSLPFESERAFMATLNRHQEGSILSLLKGAPERILPLCCHQLDCRGEQQPLDTQHWQHHAQEMARQGLRLLALAERLESPDTNTLGLTEVQQGNFVFLGLVGIIDPPREEAIDAIRNCHRAGIQVKMITGDHGITAQAIGDQLGIGRGRPALTGPELDRLDDQTLQQQVMDIDIFARASPEHKLRLVRALQAHDQVVAMTGDGVNDAPALKQADVGVAMGNKGTEAAKEAAEMVLTNDNFATISQAIHEGRAIYDNLKKAILFMLPTNGGETLVIITAILLQVALPLTPVQLLWINMITSCTLGIALAAEPSERGLMHRPPRPPKESILSKLFVWRVVMVSSLMMIGSLGLFLWELHHGNSLETARTMAVNAMVAGEICYLISSRHLFQSVLSREGLLGNPWVPISILVCALFQLLYTYHPQLQQVFNATGLNAIEWLKVLGAGLLVLVGAEVEKWVIRYFRLHPHAVPAEVR